jgi:hypothetical protein
MTIHMTYHSPTEDVYMVDVFYSSDESDDSSDSDESEVYVLSDTDESDDE